MDKKKWIILLVLFLLLLCMTLYRTIFRKVLHVNLSDITIENKNYFNKYYEVELGLEKYLVEDILSNPDKYKFVYYVFDVKNISKSLRAFNLNIKPIFEDEFKKKVIWYNKHVGVAPIAVDPQKERNGIKLKMLVRTEKYSNEEIINLAKKVRFKVTGITGSSLLNIGYDSEFVEYRKK